MNLESLCQKQALSSAWNRQLRIKLDYSESVTAICPVHREDFGIGVVAVEETGVPFVGLKGGVAVPGVVKDDKDGSVFGLQGHTAGRCGQSVTVVRAHPGANRKTDAPRWGT